MAQVVNGRPRSPRAEASRIDETQERLVDIVVDQALADRRDEEGRRASVRKETIAIAAISLECVDRGRVERDLARLAELGPPDDEHSTPAIDVALVERDRLTDAHACDREQREQRPVRGDPDRRDERASGAQKRGEILGRVHVRRRASP
jgi:hypothetical protein